MIVSGSLAVSSCPDLHKPRRPESASMRNKRFVRCASSARRKRPVSAAAAYAGGSYAAKRDRPWSATLAKLQAGLDDFGTTTRSAPSRPRSAMPALGSSLPPEKIWTKQQQSLLAIVDRNCKMWRQKSSDLYKETSLRGWQLPTKTPNYHRRNSNTVAVDIHRAAVGLPELGPPSSPGFGERPLEHAVKSLIEMHEKASSPEQAKVYSGILGELQAGVSRVFFGPEGKLERHVTLHTLHLTDGDGCTLMQMAKWNRRGYKPDCCFPGAKRPDSKDFDLFIETLIMDLQPAFGRHEVERKGSQVEDWMEMSAHFQVPTRYRRLVQHATLQPASPNASMRPETPGKSAFTEIPLGSAPAVVAGVELENGLLVISHSEYEAAVYSWLPDDLAAEIDRSHKVQRKVEQWAEHFAAQVEKWCQSMS
eukprot:TRINITY_DN112706_c0_g1_i1.p1 TRINITY_DN112706_c0_g1~~TRINITY_DN112706_c0_g1_i1.p1  ORF type:complete len:438 (+),score=64.53 TRINITY_DN112706_c0_g1_i1:52-1314(+)